MASEETQHNILYFDPNDITSETSFWGNGSVGDSNNLMQEPEDLSIMVDLLVRIKDRDTSVTTKEDNNLSYNIIGKKTQVNFIGGTEIGDSKVLTDFFTNITSYEEKVHSLDEALCVSSIDIDFSSWYAASVIINFTDIKGAGLFNEAEYSNNPENETNNHSLFRSFFTFPAPLYTLKVKGYYGGVVSYPLHCSDTKYSFNAQTGCFDITVHFIGYTYAMLNDVQMAYLIASNVASNTVGSNYWQSQIDNKRFSSDEKTPLPKMADMFDKIKKSENISEKKNSESAKKFNNNIQEIAILDNISNQLNGYLEYVKVNYKGIRDKNSYLLTIQTTFNELDEKAVSKQKDISVLIDTLPNSEIKTQLKSQNLVPIDNKIDLTSIFKNIGDEKSKLNEQKNNLEKQINTTNVSTETSVFGMKPSLSNYMKMLIAHMETFYYCIYHCSETINSGNRKLSDLNGIDKDKIDLNLKSDFLPPFPGFDDGEKEVWIGKNYPGLDEVNLVRNFINGRSEILKTITQYNTYQPEKTDGNTSISNSNNSDGNVTIGDIWYPINAFDNSISGVGDKTSSPYSDLPTLGDKLQQTVYDRIYLRSFIANNLSSSNNIGNIFGYSEFYNMVDFTNPMINGAIISETNKLINNKTSVGKFHSNNNVYNYQYSDEKNYIVPLFEDYTIKPPDSKSKIKFDNYDKFFGVNSNENPESYKKHYATLLSDGSDKKNINPTSFKVIYGNKNVKKIYEEYYSVLLKKINEKQLSTAQGGAGLDKILKNYKFIDEKNQSVSPSFYSDYGVDSVVNRVVSNKIPPINVPGGAYKNLTKEIKINDDSLYTPNLDFSQLYKLYLGSDKKIKSNKDVFNKYLFDNKRERLSYPLVGCTNTWLDSDKYFSIFGDVLYYEINESKDIDSNNPYYKNKSTIVNRRKAYYFLQSIDLEIEDIFLSVMTDKNMSSFIQRMPKLAVLYFGSVLYYNKFRFPSSFSTSYVVPDGNEYFSVNGYFKLIVSGEAHIKQKYGKSKLFYDYKNKDNIYQSIFTQKEEDVLIKFFEHWCDDPSSEWGRIKNSFELFKNFSVDEIYAFIDDLSTKTSSDGKKILMENNKIDKNILNNFIFISPIKGKYNLNSLLLVNKDDTDGVNAILDLYLTESLLFYVGKCDPQKGFNQPSMKSTFSMIGDSINKNKNNTSSTNTNQKTNADTTGNIDIEDLNLSTYNYFKTLYDKWVSGFKLVKDGDLGSNTNDTFQWITNNKKGVNGWEKGSENDPYYIKNFKFINKAYKDIGGDIRVDFKKLFDMMSGSIEQKTLYSTIGDVMSLNQMLFLPLPSYQSWETVDKFKEIFKPKPNTDNDIIREFSNNGPDSCLYICMYAGKPSSSLNLGGTSSIKHDSYDIQPSKNTLPKAHTNVGTNDNAIGGNIMKNIPSFGVTFAKQNQQYFKNVSLNSSNPNTTDASIGALENIINNANQKSSRTSIGQDLYNLYSKYSFSCDVEMMGCPQIQPMMYFQLNGIPMWGGAYMIYKIKHSIKPGKMLTSFTGMRMSAIDPKLVETPFLSLDSMIGGGTNLGLNDLNNGNDSLDWKSYNEISSTEKFRPDSDVFFIKNYFAIGFNNNNNKIKKSIYNRLAYLSQFIELINSSWTASHNSKLIISNAYRPDAKNPSSAHKLGLACDIQIEGQIGNQNLNRELYILIQNLMREGLRIDQLILEDKLSNKTKWVIHVGVGRGDGIPTCTNGIVNSKGEYFEAKGDNDKKVEGTYGVIQEAKYPQNITTNLIENTSVEKKANEVSVKNYLKAKGLSQIQVAAIMGNIQQESTFNLLVPNGKASIGLIHWTTGKYGYADTIDGVISKIGVNVNTQMDFLTNGSTYKYNDWVSKTYNSVLEATKGFCDMVERPDKTKNNGDIEKRIDYANKFYQRFKTESDSLYW